MSRGEPEAKNVRPDELDAVIHERVRLSITAVLAARQKVEYLELLYGLVRATKPLDLSGAVGCATEDLVIKKSDTDFGPEPVVT